MKNFKLSVVTLAILTLLFSCEKDEIRQSETIEPPQIVMNEVPEAIKLGQQLGGLKSGSVDYYNDLDWENTVYLDVNYNGYNKRIYLPCTNSSVALTYADQTSRFDVRKEEGWRLLYNWIPTNSNDPVRVLAFILYNKYRGKMKVFFYNAQSINTNGNVMGILGVSTGNTEVFNFSSVIANPVGKTVECGVSQSSYQNINHYGIGLMPNHWYVFEYDMSNYDSSIDHTRELVFYVYGIDLTQVQLEGATTGTTTGQLTKVFNPNEYNSLITNKKLNGAIDDGTTSLLSSVGKDNLPDVFTKLKSKTSSSVLKFVFGKLGDDSTIKNIAGAIGGGFAGLLAKPVSKLIGKLFPPKNKPTYEITDVSLKTSLKSEFTGTLTTNNSLVHYTITPPQSAANSNCYASKFGVFRIKSTPKIYVQERFTFNRLEDDNGVIYPSYEDQLLYAQNYFSPMGYTRNLSDYSYVQKATLENFANLIEFNPDLLDDATVEYDASIVIYNSAKKIYMNNLTFENDAEGVILNSDGSAGFEQLIIAPEPINGIYTFLYNIIRPRKFIYQISPFPPTTSSPDLSYMNPDPGMRVKVTIRITPNNGDSPVVINQLIQPQLIANQTREPEPVLLTSGNIGRGSSGGGVTPREIIEMPD
jgi:hypothetical protein